jgi:hypothetical protein
MLQVNASTQTARQRKSALGQGRRVRVAFVIAVSSTFRRGRALGFAAV